MGPRQAASPAPKPSHNATPVQTLVAIIHAPPDSLRHSASDLVHPTSPGDYQPSLEDGACCEDPAMSSWPARSSIWPTRAAPDISRPTLGARRRTSACVRDRSRSAPHGTSALAVLRFGGLSGHSFRPQPLEVLM